MLKKVIPLFVSPLKFLLVVWCALATTTTFDDAQPDFQRRIEISSLQLQKRQPSVQWITWEPKFLPTTQFHDSPTFQSTKLVSTLSRQLQVRPLDLGGIANHNNFDLQQFLSKSCLILFAMMRSSLYCSNESRMVCTGQLPYQSKASHRCQLLLTFLACSRTSSFMSW